MNNRLIFVGQRQGQYRIIYDGQQVGPRFDEIFIAYCCEPVGWSVKSGDGQYVFQGKRGDRYYLVRVMATSPKTTFTDVLPFPHCGLSIPIVVIACILKAGPLVRCKRWWVLFTESVRSH